MGSWATTQPPGRTAAAIRAQDHRRVDHVQQQEAAERQVDRLGQAQVLAGLGDGQHLAVGGGGRGHLVPGRRVGVDGVDPAVVADDLGQGDRHVAPAGAHVDTGPARSDPQPVEGGGERSPVDVVAQASQFHPATLPAGPPRPGRWRGSPTASVAGAPAGR